MGANSKGNDVTLKARHDMLHDPIRDVATLEDLLSVPTEATVEVMRQVPGDLVVLGIGGKMGPTLARMARRASDLAGTTRKIIGVSRFSSAALPERLHSWDIATHSCDLLDRESYAALPDAPNIVFMAGMKFGSTEQEARTWAMNTFVPGLVAERYRTSRIVVFSTGNVYGLCPLSLGGSVETDALNPVGDYAMSCLGRERIFEHFSRVNGTSMTILRLNYATELRYGVLLDIAQRVFEGRAVSLGMGHLNSIWQADASSMSLQSLCHTSAPPTVLNIAGPETLSVRRIATSFGDLFGRAPCFEGEEACSAILSNAGRAIELFGYPTVGINTMLARIAQWVSQGGETLGKPTHFEVRSGRF